MDIPPANPSIISRKPARTDPGWVPAFLKRSCSVNNLKRDDERPSGLKGGLVASCIRVAFQRYDRNPGVVFSAIADPQGCAFAFRTKRKSLRDGAKASKSSASVVAILRPSESSALPTGEVTP